MNVHGEAPCLPPKLIYELEVSTGHPGARTGAVGTFGGILEVTPAVSRGFAIEFDYFELSSF